MNLGFYLLMILPLVLFVIIPIALVLLKPFSNTKNLTGFRLESTNTKKIEHFISLFTILCIAYVWLVIIGVDYSKNKNHYHIFVRDTKKDENGHTIRILSFFQSRSYYF